MTKKRRRLDKGVELVPTGLSGEDLTREGELALDSDDSRLKVRAESGTRTVVTEDQSQTLENKTIDGTDATGNNEIKADASDITYDNTASGSLGTTSQAALDILDNRADIDEQNLADHIVDAIDAHDASAISFDNTTSSLVADDVQEAIDEVEGRLDTAQSDIITNATNLSNHLVDTDDAHDASAISFDNAASGLTASNAQAALDEIEGRLETNESVAGGKPDLASSNDNRLVKTDGANDLQETTILVTDGNAIGGVSELAVGDLNLQSNVIRAVGGNLSLNPDGEHIELGFKKLAHQPNVDAALQGSNASISTIGSYNIYTNSNLESIGRITTPTTDGCEITLTNSTGDSIQIINNSGSGSGSPIITGTGENLELANESSITLIYDGTNFNVIGGTGAGNGSGINYVEKFENDGLWTVSQATDIQVNVNQLNPQRGTKDLQILKVAAQDGNGEFAAFPFTIDRADRLKVLPINGDYLTGTNVLDNDFELVIRDVTNSQDISVINGDLIESPEGQISKRFSQVYFQTTESLEYELRVYVRRNTTDALSLIIDNLSIGPQNITSSGSFISDWEDFTPTGTWTSNTTYAGKYRRVGSSLEVEATVSLTGPPNATGLLVDIPSGLSIDPSKLSKAVLNFGVVLGDGIVADNQAGGAGPIAILYDTPTRVRVSYEIGNSSGIGTVNNVEPIPFTNNDTINIRYTAPILGWDTGVKSSEISSQLPVHLYAKSTNSQFIPASSEVTVIYNDVADQLGNIDYDSTTGIATILKDGIYSINATARTLTETMSFANIFVVRAAGGQDVFDAASSDADAVFSMQTSTEIRLFKGDTVDFRITTFANANLQPSGNGCFFTITRQNDLSALQSPTETVAARYLCDTGQSVASQSTIVYNILSFDTHNMYNTSTGELTVPLSGKYKVDASARVNEAFTSGERMIMRLKVNDIEVKVDIVEAQTPGTFDFVTKIADTINVEAGDIITITVDSGGGDNLSAAPTSNVFSIIREGN